MSTEIGVTAECKSVIAACCILLQFSIVSVVTDACSVVYPTVSVGTSFRVRVTDRGHPVPSLHVVLRLAPSNAFAQNTAIDAVTDQKGYADFADLKPGSFVLTPDHDANIMDGAMVEVSTRGTSNVTVALQWPSTKPLRVRALAGVLRVRDFYVTGTQPQFSLSLLEGASNRVADTTTTDSQGRFDFDKTVPAGLYFIRFVTSGASEDTAGMIPIEIDRNAKHKILDLDIGWSSCGPEYAERLKLPEKEVTHVSGTIADPLGAAVSNAQVFLFTGGENSRMLAQTRSSNSGRFVIEEHREGTYQLLIESPGFAPYLRQIRLKPERRTDEDQDGIRVILRVM